MDPTLGSRSGAGFAPVLGPVPGTGDMGYSVFLGFLRHGKSSGAGVWPGFQHLEGSAEIRT